MQVVNPVEHRNSWMSPDPWGCWFWSQKRLETLFFRAANLTTNSIPNLNTILITSGLLPFGVSGSTYFSYRYLSFLQWLIEFFDWQDFVRSIFLLHTFMKDHFKPSYVCRSPPLISCIFSVSYDGIVGLFAFSDVMSLNTGKLLTTS